MQIGLAENRVFGISQEHRNCEYLLVARLDTVLHNKIAAEQQYFSLQYPARDQHKIKPQLEVASFTAREEMEPTIIRWMHRIISVQNSFALTLNNYSGFPPNTVYLRIPELGPFQQLTQALKPLDGYMESCGCNAIKLNNKPHIAIAKKLTEANYLQAMLDFSQRSFHEKFAVEELILLRRKHAFDSSVQVNKFSLQPFAIKG
jgi:2'-5' RNA ligase